MKKTPLSTLLLVVTLLFIAISIIACSKKSETPKVDEVRLVKTMLVKSSDLSGIRYFPARVDANKKAELAFRVAGKIQQLLVKEGDLVKKGEVIANLDPTDFKITLKNKQALFTRAKKDYFRAKRLVKEGHISKMDFDKLESAYQTTQSDLNLAEQQLAYTQLKAPFDGIIAQRHIENYEEIQSKQTIVTLNDNQILDIKFDLPENLILSLRKQQLIDNKEDATLRNHISVNAIFQNQKNKEYSLQYKEISTKANEQTQTFAVTYTMPKPKNVIILPGMSATVKADFSHYTASNKDIFYLPVSAVVSNVDLQATVWVVDQNMQVQPQQVKVAQMKGNRIQVTEGITAGQRIVIAGVPFLYQGLKVSLMKKTEQARDNIEHQPPQMKLPLSTQKQEQVL